MKRMGWSVWINGALTLLGSVFLAFVLAALIRNHIGQIIWVKGSSMEKTLRNRDIVLVRKWGGYSRGEVVICRYPGKNELILNLGAAFSVIQNTVYVKRLVALPGDSVEISEGTLYVNDQPVPDPPLMGSAPRDYPRRLLGKKQYFVIGDNRALSHDSRGADVGPIRENMLAGHARLILWPLKRAGRIR